MQILTSCQSKLCKFELSATYWEKHFRTTQTRQPAGKLTEKNGTFQQILHKKPAKNPQMLTQDSRVKSLAYLNWPDLSGNRRTHMFLTACSKNMLATSVAMFSCTISFRRVRSFHKNKFLIGESLWFDVYWINDTICGESWWTYQHKALCYAFCAELVIFSVTVQHGDIIS